MSSLINIRTNLATMRNNDAAVYDPNIYGFGPTTTAPNVALSSAVLANNMNAMYDPEIYGYKSNLVELKSNLTQLKFGNDRPGNGSSGLPYIQTSIPPTPYLLDTTGPGFPLFTPETTGNLDYPIRGGQVQFQIGQQTFTLASQIDKVRIQKFFKDAPRGNSFIEKQVGLQLSNPKIETSVGSIFGTANVPGPIENTRVYNNGVNTLAQIGVSGTGAHAVRHGMVPFAPFQKNYYLNVNEQNILGNVDGTLRNRLTLLYSSKMSTPGTSNFVNPINLNIDINRINSLGISLNRNLLFQYLGGPGSSYGIGSTTIRRFVDTSNLSLQNPIVPAQLKNNYEAYGRYNTSGEPLAPNEVNTTGNQNPPLNNRLLLLRDSKIVANIDSYGNLVIENLGLKNWGISKNKNALFFYPNGPGSITKGEDGKVTVDKSSTGIRRYTDTTQVKSSRTMVYSELASQNINDPVYKAIEEPGLTTAGKFRDIQDFRSELGQTGWSFTDSVDYKFYLPKTYIDKINSLKPFVFNNDKNPWDVKSDETQDLIKFVFEAISNDNTSKSTAIFFRAFLNGTIGDNNSATWNSFKYQGRGENFYTYQGFDRSISFSFKVYASSPREVNTMYSRLNALLSQVYPDYTKDQGIMRGSIIRLTIGDYIKRMPGFLESVNLTVDSNMGWEVTENYQVPHVVDVQVTFKPILEQLPKRSNETEIPGIIYKNNTPEIISKTAKTPDQPNPPIPGYTIPPISEFKITPLEVSPLTVQQELTRKQKREQRKQERQEKRQNRRQIAIENRQLQETGFDPMSFNPKGDILGN